MTAAVPRVVFDTNIFVSGHFWVAHESAVGGVLQPQHAALPHTTLELADVRLDDAAFFRQAQEALVLLGIVWP